MMAWLRRRIHGQACSPTWPTHQTGHVQVRPLGLTSLHPSCLLAAFSQACDAQPDEVNILDPNTKDEER